MANIFEDIGTVTSQLDSALQTFRANGIEKADAEREYRKLKSKKILEYKQAGYPVTLIIDIVRGLDDVAELAFQRDVADSVYNANKEAINVKKIELKHLHNVYEMEWSQSKND